jgi:hypothetical protein
MPEEPQRSSERAGIEMPRPTTAPIMVALGAALLAGGVALSLAMSYVGAVILFVGLAGWIAHLMPGKGHFHERRAGPDRQPEPVVPTPGAVAHLDSGMPGYRMRLPLKVHPISAGIKGGILGGLLMPIPALAWGMLSGHGPWYPVNLLAGMVMAGVEDMPVGDLEKFQLPLLLVGIVIHVVMSLILGLMYGVLLPTLPAIRGGQIAWGGVLMPLLWTGFTYGLMGVVNPLLQHAVDWLWFVVSQFVFGVTAAIVVIRTEKVPVPPAGMGSDTESWVR